MRDKLNRRDFISITGASVASSLSVTACGAGIDPEVAEELKDRMKFLSPPDGIPSDLEARPSPSVEPFGADLFVPPIARPLINLTDPSLWTVDKTADGSSAWVNLHPDLFTGEQTIQSKSLIDGWLARLVRENVIVEDDLVHLQPHDKAWLIVFYRAFHELSEKLLESGIDIGGFPLVRAHQRFFDFKPMKFYAIWEMEFPWKFTDSSSSAGRDSQGRMRKGANWQNGSWSWGFAQLAEEWSAIVEFKADARSRPQQFQLSNAIFDAMSPGPTFKAKYDEPILVRRINQLPEILDDDHSWKVLKDGSARRHIKFALPSTTTHLHNAHTASESDGHPNDWINPGEYWDHHYGNFPSGYDNREKLSTLWYHDHRMDFTASNVYAGLDGFYFLFDQSAILESDVVACEVDEEQCLITQSGDLNNESHGWGLPAKEFDIPLIFHDLLFDADTMSDAQLVFDGFNTDGILGDRYTVNRVIQPRCSVKRRKYRFRLLNGGPSRFYELFLHTNSAREFFNAHGKVSVETPEQEPAPFVVIAGDGNFQPNPLLVRSIFMGVAQRNDVVIDFSAFGSDVKHVYLVNRLSQTNGRGPDGRRISPSSSGMEDVDDFLNEFTLVRFDLEDGAVDDPSRVPLKFRDFPPVDLTEVKRERIWDFDYDGGLWTINGLTYDPNRIDAGIEQDSAEIWTFRNTGNSWSHPIHSHFTEFIVLEINGVPQYQSTVQTSDIPRRAGFGSFQSDEQINEGLRKSLEYQKEQIPEIIESARKSYQQSLEKRESRKAEHQRQIQQYSLTEATPLSQDAVRSRIAEYEAALSDHLAEKATAAGDPSHLWFFLMLLQFLLQDETSEKPKYDLITDPLRILIGVPGSVTPLEIIQRIRFERFAQLLQAVEFLKDSAFWNLVLDGSGTDKQFANLDWRGNLDNVKGDGRFMGGPRRDVALILPNWEVKVFMRWKDFLGKHVMHCHNVVHEDHAMMIRWDILPPGHGFDTPKYTSEVYGSREGIPHVQPAPKHSQSHPHDSDLPKGR